MSVDMFSWTVFDKSKIQYSCNPWNFQVTVAMALKVLVYLLRLHIIGFTTFIELLHASQVPSKVPLIELFVSMFDLLSALDF